MVKYLRRAGHDVTVLTTSAYGTLDGEAETGIERTADAQLWRAKLRGADSVGSHVRRRHLLGHASSAQQGDRPRAARARVGAVRDPAGEGTPSAAAVRLRHHHLAARVSALRRPRAQAPGRGLGRRRPRRLDLRAAATRVSRPRLSGAWTNASSAGRSAALTPWSASPSPPPKTFGAVASPTRSWSETARTPSSSTPPIHPSVADLLDPDRVSLVYTGRFGSTGRDPRALIDGLRRLAREHPDDAARLELVAAGPLRDDEAQLFSADVAPARISVVGSLPRDRALALQRSADACSSSRIPCAHSSPTSSSMST